MRPSASIILCTQNRAKSLHEALAFVGRCAVPGDIAVELLVVDNGSLDETRLVAERARLANMPLRYIHEPRRGKGYAYNAGIAAAAGEGLLFTDDDVRVPANWIQGMCRPILEGKADAVAGGVRFAPHLERGWFETRHRDWLASTDSINPVVPDRLVGANMAIRASVFEVIEGFDPELGPGASGFGDETLLARQITHAGFKIRGAMDVVVEHWFDDSRLCRRGFLEIARKIGRSDCYMIYHWDHYDNSRPRWTLIRHMAKMVLLYLRNGLDLLKPGHIPGWEMNAWKDVAFHRAYLVERLRPRNYERFGYRRISGEPVQPVPKNACPERLDQVVTAAH